MGNFSSCGSSKSRHTGKVVLLDGSVEEYDNPITVAELMLEHPQQVVVEFPSAVTKRRVIPLPADKKLEMKQTYLMLPIETGKQPGLTNEETERFLSILNSLPRSRHPSSSPKFLSLGVSTSWGGGRGKSRWKKKKEYMEEFRTGPSSRNPLLELLPETSEERPTILHRRFSLNGWKPSLETIEEGSVERKWSRVVSFHI